MGYIRLQAPHTGEDNIQLYIAVYFKQVTQMLQVPHTGEDNQCLYLR